MIQLCNLSINLAKRILEFFIISTSDIINIAKLQMVALGSWPMVSLQKQNPLESAPSGLHYLHLK